MHSNWTLFKSLCRVIGGQDNNALTKAHEDGLLPQLVEMAEHQDLLPALAMRIDEQPVIKQALSEAERQLLQQALQENTRRNMQTVMQALKLARSLNSVGITPTFLKGTAQLLTVNEARLGFRKQVDIDLVVAPNEIEGSCEALLNAGYGFYREATGASNTPDVLHNIGQAQRTSAAHHHLPPLVMDGYGSCVEIHRHFLPKRFQLRNPLTPLLTSASEHQSHGATFRIPSAEYQLIHMVLGKMVHDGHLARRTFPTREACDYIEWMESVEGRIDKELVARHCGKNHAIFSQLVRELMGYTAGKTTSGASNIKRRIDLMAKRYNSDSLARLLDAHARAIHLGHSILNSPTKLPAYLNRLTGR